MANKNKSKKNTQKAEVIYDKWLYMNEKEITVVDINDAIKNITEVDLWDQLGVMSLKLADNSYMDIEEIETDLGDDKGNKFVEDNNIKSIFTVKMMHDYYEEAEKLMKLITKELNGFFAEDNEDFSPIIK